MNNKQNHLRLNSIINENKRTVNTRVEAKHKVNCVDNRFSSVRAERVKCSVYHGACQRKDRPCSNIDAVEQTNHLHCVT